jgi:hypothetical protein
VYQAFATASFMSIWYWVLHGVVWTLACYRTLGVPQDMLVRARRRPEIAARVDTLARLASARAVGIYRTVGVPLAAAGGFVLAMLFAIGFGEGVELAQAGFLLMFPLAVIVYSKLRLALAVRERKIDGAALVLALARRRMWHQFVAVFAVLAAAAAAFARYPLPPQ